MGMIQFNTTNVSTSNLLERRYINIPGQLVIDNTSVGKAWMFVTERSFYLRFVMDDALFTVELGLGIGNFINNGVLTVEVGNRRDNEKYTRKQMNKFECDSSWIWTVKGLHGDHFGPSNFKSLEWDLVDKLQFLGLYKPVFPIDVEGALTPFQVEVANVGSIHEAMLELGLA